MGLRYRLRPGSSIFSFIKNQFQVLKVKFFVQSETEARLFTGKFIVFVNVLVFKSSVSLPNISLQLLTCPATPLSVHDLLCNEMGPKSPGHTRDVTLIAQNSCVVLFFQLYFEQLCKVKILKGKYQNNQESLDFQILK